MRKIGLFIIILVGVLGIIYFAFLSKKGGEKVTQPQPMAEQTVKITSPVFSEGGTIPTKYTCDGDDVNPPLNISGVPASAKNLVLIVDDPDAPMGTWNHWLVWNINPKISEIKEGRAPEGAVLGTNDFGKLEYGGPCPPSGVHRYFFKLYVLDTILDLPEGSKKGKLEASMKAHIIASGELMGKYSRE